MSDFIKNALARGPKGQIWLDSIPEIIKQCSQKWHLVVYKPYNLSYNYVAPATRTLTDGTKQEVVLKISYPGDKETRSEILALRHYNGEGMVQLLAEDPENSAVLIERVTPGLPLSDLDDDQATRILAGVMKKIRKSLPKDNTFTPLSIWALGFEKLKDQHNGSYGPLPQDITQKAEQLFSHLIATSTKLVLTHADLHHDNVLSSDSKGWIAIDPKGIAAEPEYEVAAMIRNPLNKLSALSDAELEKIIKQRLEILSAELGFDPKRLIEWSFAQTMLSAVWDVEEGKFPKHSLRVARVLEKLLYSSAN